MSGSCFSHPPKLSDLAVIGPQLLESIFTSEIRKCSFQMANSRIFTTGGDIFDMSAASGRIAALRAAFEATKSSSTCADCTKPRISPPAKKPFDPNIITTTNHQEVALIRVWRGVAFVLCCRFNHGAGYL